MKKVVTLFLFIIALFCVSNTVRADEKIYLYLHDPYSNRESKWEITDQTFGSTYYIPSFQREGYKITGYTYDKEGLYVIPEGANGVYMFYGRQNGVLIHSSMKDKITSDFHMYAIWSPIKYNIIYHLDEGINDVSNPDTYRTDQIVTLMNPTKEGYRFVGWYVDEGYTKTIAKIEKGTIGELHLYAKWECLHERIKLQKYKEATCCEEGYSGDGFCMDCGEKIRGGEIIIATGLHETVTVGNIEPTCVEDGYSGDVYCTNSGNPVREGEVIPATGIHELVMKDKKEATCTEEGYEGNAYCKVCEALIEKGRTIPMTEHLYDHGKITLEPTELTTGIRTFTCEVCQSTQNEILPLVVKECRHEKTIIKNMKTANCKEKGYSGDIYCQDCAALLEEGISLPVTNTHTWMLMSIKPANTQHPGEKKYSCGVCELEKTEVIPQIETEQKEETDIHAPSSVDTENEKERKEDSVASAKKQKVIIKKITEKKQNRICIVLKRIKGYQYEIQVSKSKKFKKGVKKYTTSKVKYTVKKLKKGKVYYVKARTYKVIDGKRYYGKWSVTKKIKIKK